MKKNKDAIKNTLERLDKMSDEDIDYTDIPELDSSFFKKALVGFPIKKEQVTLRLDSDVLDWFKSQGKGYQTKINKILRLCMETSK